MMTPVCPRPLNMITGFVALLSSGLRGFKCHRSFIIIIMMLKNIFSVMSARLMLAAIDWNNSSREQCQDQAGKASTTAVYSKRRKTFILRSTYNHGKTNFAAILMRRFCQVHKDKITLPNFARPALPANVAKIPKPSKAELEGRYRSRFAR